MSIQTMIQSNNAATNPDAGYKWYLDNRDEIIEINQSTELLRTLEELEREQELPEGTALRFKQLYEEACAVSEQQEALYASTWDAYHEALDTDPNLASLARAFSETERIPLYKRIDANGAFIF